MMSVFRIWMTCFLLTAPVLSIVQADESVSDGAKAEQLVLQHSATSNSVKTVIQAPIRSMPKTELQKRKERSMQQLNKRAEDLVHAWKLRQVREAVAAIKAEEEANARIEAAAEKARQEALAEKAPPAPEPKEPTRSVEPTEVAQPAVPTKPMAELPPEQPVQVQEPVELPETPQNSDVASPEFIVTDVPKQIESPTTPKEPQDPAAMTSVEGPIDRMALATSLFATESYKECLSILDAVDRKSISTESSDWCDYLAASCYRKLQNLPEAESRYRNLLGRTEVSWLANATRWWLDNLNEQKKLRTDLIQLNTNFTAWQAEIDDLRTAD